MTEENKKNLLQIRLFDLEIALADVIVQNTSLNEELLKERVSNNMRIKKISELMKVVQTYHSYNNDIYKSMSNE